MIAAAITTIGLDCAVELQKTDGTIIDISGKTIGKKVVGIGSAIADEIQEKINSETEDK